MYEVIMSLLGYAPRVIANQVAAKVVKEVAQKAHQQSVPEKIWYGIFHCWYCRRSPSEKRKEVDLKIKEIRNASGSLARVPLVGTLFLSSDAKAKVTRLNKEHEDYLKSYQQANDAMRPKVKVV